MSRLPRAGSRPRAIVLGGGFGGAYAAQRLSRRLPKDWDLTLVDRNNFLLFYPLLVEAGVGSLEARHVVVPLRKFLKRGDLIMAEVTGVDLKRQTVEIHVVGADKTERLHYDQLIIAIGSTTKFPPVPGLAEHAFELKSLADGIDLRDRGIRLLELANTIQDAERRRAILRIVIVGASFSGIELAGEYDHFLRGAAKSYHNVDDSEIKVVVLELSDRILNTLEPELSDYALRHLLNRGLDIRTNTSLKEVHQDYVILTTGERLDTRTTVWCAGIAPSHLLDCVDAIPRTPQGYIDCSKELQVSGFDNVWAIGDGATVQDRNGNPYAATAQNATRQGMVAADNLIRSIKDEPLKPFEHESLGTLAEIGCRTAVAKVFGIRLAGFPAWFMFRTVYLFKMPSWSRRFRIMMDWTADLFVRAEPVQLGIRRKKSLDP